MAEQSEIVLDVKVNTDEVAQKLGEATRQVSILKQEQKNLDKALAEGAISATDYGKAMAESKMELEKANREVKSSTALLQAETMARIDDTASLDEQRQALNAAQKAYGLLSGEEKKAADAAGGLRDQIKALSDRVKEQESALGDNRRNVGNYVESIQEAAGGMGGFGAGITGIIAPLKNANAVMKVMAANPLIAALGVLIAVLMKIHDAFKNNAAAMEQLNEVMGVFSGVANIVNVIIDKIAAGIGWVAEKALDLAYKLHIISDSMREGQEIAREDLAIQKAQQEAALKTAEDTKRIAELKAEVAEKDKYTAAQRLKKLEEANKLEEQIAQRSFDLAKREYELQVKKNNQSASSIDDLKKENDLKIAMINAETALFNKKKELNGQLAGVRAEEAAKAKAESDARLKQIQEEAAALQAIRDEMVRRSRTQLENDIADLEKKREEEKKIAGLTAEELLAIDDYYNAEIAKKREEAAKAEKDNADKLNAELAAKQKEAADYLKSLQDKTLDETYADNLAKLQQYYDEGLIATEEYEAAKAQIEDEYRNAKAEKEAAAAQTYLSSLEALNNAVAQIESAALAQYEQGQNDRKKALEKRLKAGEISQEKYEEEVAKMDEETERKKIQMEREQAIREKALGIMSATISTAQAIIKALADPGGFAGIALSVLAGATGAAQIAAITAQPLPQFATGGIVGGNSYSGDQVLARLNSGEMVLNQESQQRLFDALSSDNGKSIGFDYEMMAAAVAAQPAPVVVYKELQDFGDKVTTYNEIAAV